MQLDLEIVPLRGEARKASSHPHVLAAPRRRNILHSVPPGGWGQKGMGPSDVRGTRSSWQYFFSIVVGILHPQAMLRGWAPDTHRDVPDSTSALEGLRV